MGFPRSQTLVFLSLMLFLCLVSARQLKNHAKVEEGEEGKASDLAVAVNHADPARKKKNDEANVKKDVGEINIDQQSPPFPPLIPGIPGLPVPYPVPVPVPTTPIPIPVPTIPLPPIPPIIPGFPPFPIPSPPL